MPDAVARSLTASASRSCRPPACSSSSAPGTNAWTAAEGALKVREAAYVATEGLGVEQYVHGPSVAIGAARHARRARRRRARGRRASTRPPPPPQAAGATVHRLTDRSLPEPLSIFPLTAAVQRIALELSEALGTDPDTFGAELPGHERWAALEY